MQNTSEILKTLSALKPWLYREYFVIEIGLFGSYADGTFTEASDIDVLVELEQPIGWRFFSLELYLKKVFGKEIDLVTKNALKAQLKSQILSTVIYA